MAAATQITTGKVRFSYNNLFTPAPLRRAPRRSTARRC